MTRRYRKRGQIVKENNRLTFPTKRETVVALDACDSKREIEFSSSYPFLLSQGGFFVL